MFWLSAAAPCLCQRAGMEKAHRWCTENIVPVDTWGAAGSVVFCEQRAFTCLMCHPCLCSLRVRYAIVSVFVPFVIIAAAAVCCLLFDRAVVADHSRLAHMAGNNYSDNIRQAVLIRFSKTAASLPDSEVLDHARHNDIW